MLELFGTDWRELWGHADNQEPLGAIFTKPEIVELILDLAGYQASETRLALRPLLEPSCGDGAFLLAAVQRLLASEVRTLGAVDWDSEELASAIRAVDISLPSVLAARSELAEIMKSQGASEQQALRLAETWVVQADFLLADWPNQFEFVIGNPPYVRIEGLPRLVLHRYRDAFATLTDRADLYVAFFERGLQLLSKTGTLAFICANRFTKNQYGEALRRLIAKRYRVRHYINLEHTQPFLSGVSAYPAIIVIDRAIGKPTRAATLDNIEPETVNSVRTHALSKEPPTDVFSEFESWYANGEPWISTSVSEYAIIEKLNQSLPVLEDSGPATRVGIGVATGADNVFILDAKHPEIEDSRQIPLLIPRDVGNAGLAWSGRYLLNPFADSDDGQLVNFCEFPGFKAYIEASAAQLKGRHVAKTRPNTWYRTIDRVWPSLTATPKLVIPDIQRSSVIGYDCGEFYPHHNLYWIASESWPLLALKTLLRSSLVFQQVKAYSVQMRGGSVRFQAQTLRRVRLPHVSSLSPAMLDELIRLAESEDQAAIDAAAVEAFGIVAGGKS